MPNKGFCLKKLATIICDAPVDFDEKALELEKPNEKAFAKFFPFWNSEQFQSAFSGKN